MISIDFLNLSVFLLIVYLAVQILKKTLFLIYVVQLKEYRFDRLKAWFKTKTGRREFLNHFNLLKWKKLIIPKITLRSIFIFITTVLLHYNLFFLLLRLAFKIFKNLTFNIVISIVLTLFTINLAAPLIVITSLFLSLLFFYPLKELIYYLAKQKRKRYKNLQVVGVTGSYGKTAVKEILWQLVKDDFISLKTPKNCNTQAGIGMLMLLKLRKKHQLFIVEMGAYRRGEIEKICKMVRPKIGIVTAVNSQHLELFGSISNTQWAKYELVKSLPDDGLAILNGSSKYVKRLIKTTSIEKKVYGIKKINYKTKLVGDWHKKNIEAAVFVAKWLGVSEKQILKRVKKLQKIPLGLSVEKGFKDAKIINDSYSANPRGFEEALKFLKKQKGKKKILITPGIIELGKNSEKIHKKIGSLAGKICSKVFITKKDFADEICSGMSKKRRDEKVEVLEDSLELLERIKEEVGSKSVVLVEGRISDIILQRLLKND